MNAEKVDSESVYRLLTNNVNYKNLMFMSDKQRFLRTISFEEVCVFLRWEDIMTMPGINNNSWQIANNAFLSVGTREDFFSLNKRLREHQVVETQRPLTAEEMRDWQTSNLKKYAESGLKLEDLNREAWKSRIYPSSVELLRHLLENYSKICIVSSGIKNVIEGTLNFYGIDQREYENLQINATELIFNKAGTLIGWDDNSIVTANRKPLIVHGFSRIWDIEHENIFVVGGNTDLNMLNFVDEKATMIFFCPFHKRKLLTEKGFAHISSIAHGYVKHFNPITKFFTQISSRPV